MRESRSAGAEEHMKRARMSKLYLQTDPQQIGSRATLPNAILFTSSVRGIGIEWKGG